MNYVASSFESYPFFKHGEYSVLKYIVPMHKIKRDEFHPSLMGTSLRLIIIYADTNIGIPACNALSLIFH